MWWLVLHWLHEQSLWLIISFRFLWLFCFRFCLMWCLLLFVWGSLRLASLLTFFFGLLSNFLLKEIIIVSIRKSFLSHQYSLLETHLVLILSHYFIKWSWFNQNRFRLSFLFIVIFNLWSLFIFISPNITRLSNWTKNWNCKVVKFADFVLDTTDFILALWLILLYFDFLWNLLFDWWLDIGLWEFILRLFIFHLNIWLFRFFSWGFLCNDDFWWHLRLFIRLNRRRDNIEFFGLKERSFRKGLDLFNIFLLFPEAKSVFKTWHKKI